LETRPWYEQHGGKGKVFSGSLPSNAEQQIPPDVRWRGWRSIAGTVLGLGVLFFIAYIAGLGHIFRSFVNPAQSESRPQIFRYFIAEDPIDLDPQSYHATGSGEGLRAALFDGLFEIDSAGLPVPSLATEWTVNQDATAWVFHLRPEAKWSDGTRITAQDFVYSWKRALSPHLQLYQADQLYLLKGGREFYEGKTQDLEVDAVDDNTLSVTLTEPAVYLPKLLALPVFRPVPRQAIERWGGKMWATPEHIVTSGAFRVREKTIDRLTLERNPLFWDIANTRLEQIDFRFAAPSTLVNESGTSGITLYDRGDVDAVASVSDEARDQFQDKEELISVYAGVQYIYVNSVIKPLDDLRVREALCLAIDRKQLLGKDPYHAMELSIAFVPPMPGYDGIPPGDYIPGYARRNLAESGYPDGKNFPKIEYFYDAAESHRKIAQVLKDSWSKELGIQVDLREENFGDYLPKVHNRDFNGLAIIYWVPDFNDPFAFLQILRSNNEDGYGQLWKNSKFDEKLKEANREFDQGRRSALLTEAESIALSDLPIIPLQFTSWSLLRKPYVKNFSPSSPRQLNLREVYLEN